MSKVPSQTLAALCGSRISAAHLPQGLCRTPLYLRLLSPDSSGTAVGSDGSGGAAAEVGVVDMLCVAVSGSGKKTNRKDENE